MKTNLFLTAVVTLGCLSFANAQSQAVTKTGKLVTVNTPASTTVEGIVQLAGDLTGTSTVPEIGLLKVTAAKLADAAVETIKIKDANVTVEKIAPGTANQVLTTDAAGTAVVWAASSSVTNASDSATATALQSSFTLTNTPKSLESITAFRNGVATNFGGFTLAGAVVTITTSDLEEGDLIVFKYVY
jgi:hypothetical protein